MIFFNLRKNNLVLGCGVNMKLSTPSAKLSGYLGQFRPF